MAIVKMNKFTLLAFESKKEALLEKLQGFSSAEFIDLQDENLLEDNELLQDLTKDVVDSDIANKAILIEKDNKSYYYPLETTAFDDLSGQYLNEVK